MKFSIALDDLESMVRAVLPARVLKTDTMVLSACAARVFVASQEAVAGMEALVFTDGAVKLPAKSFREVLKTYKGTRVLVFEGGADGLRVQNFHMPILAYEPAPKPPGDFQVFGTSAPLAASFTPTRETSVVADETLSGVPATPIEPEEESPTASVDLEALVREGKRLYCSDGDEMTDEHIRAFELFLRGGEADHREAHFYLGLCYANGRGVPQDFGEAAKWYRKAAEQGVVNAQNMLGSMYIRGLGVSQNSVEAFKWFRKAAEQGDAGGQYMVGLLYHNGDGVGQDYAEAVKWSCKAAEQGNGRAQYLLGLCYANGRGVPQDFGEAAKWYRKAAEQGEADGQKSLGKCYLDGRGVPQNYVEADTWYRKAAEQGDAAAQSVLAALEAFLAHDPGAATSSLAVAPAEPLPQPEPPETDTHDPQSPPSLDEFIQSAAFQARLAEVNNITHADFVSGVQNGTVGVRFISREPYQMLRGFRKALFTTFGLFYMAAPPIIISLWAYHERNRWLLVGIVVSYLGAFSAARKSKLIFLFLCLCLGVWFKLGLSIHQYITFHFFCAVWGYFFFELAEESQRTYALQTLVEDPELFHRAIAHNWLLIARKGEEVV